MKIYLLLTVVTLFVFGCSSEEKKVFLRKESHKEIKPNSVKANRILTIEIEGMTCVLGCGASIRKELFSTNSVNSVEFDFKEGREVNTANIAFDKDKITVDEMIKLITTMNEKQFKVGKTTSSDFNSPKQNSENTISKPVSNLEESTIKASSSKIEMPNFLDLIARFITRGLFRAKISE